MIFNRKIKKYIDNLLVYGETDTDSDKEIVSVLELIKTGKENFESSKHFCRTIYDYLKQNLNFITFYFRYNYDNSYDVVIVLDYDNISKTRRELVLNYDNNEFKILNEEILSEVEKEKIYADINFYRSLAYFGSNEKFNKVVIPTISGEFSLELENNYLKLNSIYINEQGKNMSICYSYDQDIIEKIIENSDNRLDSRLLSKRIWLNTEEGLMELNTDIYGLDKYLSKNNCENLLELLDYVYVYKEDLPERFNIKENAKVKKLVK